MTFVQCNILRPLLCRQAKRISILAVPQNTNPSAFCRCNIGIVFTIQHVVPFHAACLPVRL